jgi:hypothetical protein
MDQPTQTSEAAGRGSLHALLGIFMAYITDCDCNVCGKTKLEDGHTFRGVCSDCRKAEADKARRKHLAGLKGLTVEERLERIEAELYDTAANRRLGAIEAANRQYA